MKNFVRVLSLALLIALLAVSLISCGGPAKDPDDAKDALEDAGYEVEMQDGDLLKGFAELAGIDGLVAMVEAAHEDDEEGIVIFYFEESKDAKEAFESDYMQDMIEELEEEAEDEDMDVVIKQSGKMIWFGTKQAVKDAK